MMEIGWQKEMILALADKFKGEDQKIRYKKFLGEKLEKQDEVFQDFLYSMILLKYLNMEEVLRLTN